jgi:hypothetical protein
MESLPSLADAPFEVHHTEPKAEEAEKEGKEEENEAMYNQEAQALALCRKSEESRDEPRGEIAGQD